VTSESPTVLEPTFEVVQQEAISNETVDITSNQADEITNEVSIIWGMEEPTVETPHYESPPPPPPPPLVPPEPLILPDESG
jgi:hypothetical protein